MHAAIAKADERIIDLLLEYGWDFLDMKDEKVSALSRCLANSSSSDTAIAGTGSSRYRGLMRGSASKRLEGGCGDSKYVGEHQDDAVNLHPSRPMLALRLWQAFDWSAVSQG